MLDRDSCHINGMPRYAYWLVSRDTQLDSMISDLASRCGLPDGERCDGLYTLSKGLENDPRPVVIVDCDSPEFKRLANLEQTVNRFPAVRFICVSDDASPPRILEAMSVGIRHFILRGSLANELPALMRKYTVRESGNTREPTGQIVTVLSAAGGCGATTLAVNLANAYSGMSHTQALVVDLCEAYGTVATALNLNSRHTLADLLSREREQIDAQLVHNTCVAKHDGLSVLISPASVDFIHPSPLRMVNLEPALVAFRNAFNRTVIDAPRVSMEQASTLADHSHNTLILFQLNVKDLRSARAMHRGLIDMGVSPQRLRLVAGRVGKRNALTVEEACEALEVERIDTLCNDYRSANVAMNLGEPLTPNCPLDRDIRALADRIEDSQPQHAPSRPAPQPVLRIASTPEPTPQSGRRIFAAVRSFLG